jgi:hypothetical protein
MTKWMDMITWLRFMVTGYDVLAWSIEYCNLSCVLCRNQEELKFDWLCYNNLTFRRLISMDLGTNFITLGLTQLSDHEPGQKNSHLSV